MLLLVFDYSQVVPANLLGQFDETDLELLINGNPVLNVEDWKKHTKLKNVDANSDYYKWFWEIIDELTDDDRGKLLQFVTGSSRAPVQGFKYLQGSGGNCRLFTLHLVDGPSCNLPKAHTCFNRLDFYRYETKQIFYEKLMMSVNETIGFNVE